MHVLRPRAGEFVYPAQVRPRVGEDSSDDPSDISRGDRRGLAPPERQFNAASVADGRADEAEEEALQEDRRPDGDDRQAGPPERLLAEPVLPLLRARGGVLDAHLGDGHLGHVDQGVHPDVPGDRRHGHGRLQVLGGHGHAEVDPPTAADDPIDVGRFEEVSDHHLGAGGPQGRRPVVLAADHGANRKPAIEERTGHGSPDRPELTGGPGDEDRSVIGHATSLPFAELLSIWKYFHITCSTAPCAMSISSSIGAAYMGYTPQDVVVAIEQARWGQYDG